MELNKMNGKCLYKRCRKHNYCYVNFCWFCIKDYLHIKEEDKYTRLITIKEKTDFLNKYPLGCVGECVEVNKERKYCKEELSDYVKEQLIISEKIKDDLAKEGLSYITDTWLPNWLGITIKEFFILTEDKNNKKCLVEDCLNESLGYIFLCEKHWKKYNDWKHKLRNLGRILG